MERAKLAYEAYRKALGYDVLMMFQLDPRQTAAWQAVADALDAANEDKARLIEALETMIASAHPHPVEHPTMTAAWAVARAAVDQARKS